MSSPVEKPVRTVEGPTPAAIVPGAERSLSELRILIVDDDAGDRKQMRGALATAHVGGEFVEVVEMQQAVSACEEREFDCILLDHFLPGMRGVDGIPLIRERLPQVPIVLVTGNGSEEIAAESIKGGATDYVSKSNMTPDRVRGAVESAIEKSHLRRKIDEQREELRNFSRILAHDFAAPARRVHLFSDMVVEALQNGDYDEARDISLKVVQASEHMEGLIQALSCYNRLSTATIEIAPVRMDDVVAQAREIVEEAISASGAVVSPEPLPTVLGVEPLLVELMQNLIENAIKYRSDEVPEVRIRARRWGADWGFAVQDNGMGIPEKYHAEVFEPLRRVSGGNIPGTGLGLAICRRILEHLNGRIWCTSEPGSGSTFHFTLSSVPGDDTPTEA